MRPRSNSFISLLRAYAGWVVASVFVGALCGLSALLPSCDGDDRKAEAAKRQKKRANPAAVAKDEKTRAIEATVNRNLSHLAEGAKVRIVWIEDPNRKAADPFATSDSLRLGGWDSQEGGYRRIINRPGNYGRPLLTPSGNEVIYTDKRIERKGDKKYLSPEIHVLDWSGENDRVLGRGFAVEVHFDAATKRTWVYALESIIPTKSVSVSGTTLVRFPLDEPGRREVMWTRTPLSVDNFQMSRDGSRFAALFPWPDSGVGDLATGRWRKLDIGCWPSMAPDNSYVSCVFDGLHRKLRMYDADGRGPWMVDLSKAPGMDGREAYHPRWSNHPRYPVFTGPYTSKKRVRNSIATGGLTAEIHVSKFSKTLDRLESSVRVTHNAGGDFYPDLWIASGETSTLETFAQKRAFPAPIKETWPTESRQLEFLWRDLRAENEISGTSGRMPCHLEARGCGRYNAFLGAILDGGWFEADEASDAAIAAGVRKHKAFTLQALITEWQGAPAGRAMPLVSWQTTEGMVWFQLARQDGQLVAEFRHEQGLTEFRLDSPTRPGRAYALAISAAGGVARCWVDGRPLGPDHPVADEFLMNWPRGRLTVGDPNGHPDGRQAALERLTVYSRELAQTELSARAEVDLAAVKNRAWPTPLRLRGRLVEATEPTLEKLDTYHRMLVDHTYEVLEVLDGTYEEAKIVVLHWAVLDDRTVPGIPREEGRVYELRLEPYTAHPELDGELTDVTSGEFGLPMYLDATTPPAPAG